MENNKSWGLLLLLFSGLFSCQELNNNTSISNNAVADVYVKAMILNNIVVYSHACSVKGNNEISSVIATKPDDRDEVLSRGSNIYYYFEPDTSIYKDFPPGGGFFTYKVEFNNGEEKDYSNLLDRKYLIPAENMSVVRSAGGSSLRVSWDPVADADVYQIRVKRAGMTIYTSVTLLSSAGNYFDLPIVSLGNSVTGKYSFELTAILYEEGSNQLIQAMSSSTASIEL